MGTDQDENDYRRQFNAAVSVIQGLPKSGSYRPSYDEMLRFYGYYKQSTAGPCNISRPGFWDPVGRYKWDAWSKLGEMSEKEAMCAYIQEMKMVAQKIINTVPLEETSPEMFEPFRPLYEVIPDMPRPPDSLFKICTEKETPGDILEQENSEEVPETKSNSHHSAPGAEDSELGARSGQEKLEQQRNLVGEATHPAPDSCRSATAFSDSLRHDEDCDHEDSGISPRLFQASDVTHKKTKAKTRRQSAERRKDNDLVAESSSSRYVWQKNGKSCSIKSSGMQTKCEGSSHQLSPQITATVEALHASMQGLCQRLESLERALQDSHQHIAEQTRGSRKLPKSHPPGHGKSQTLLFILIWPFIVHWLLRRYLGRKV